MALLFFPSYASNGLLYGPPEKKGKKKAAVATGPGFRHEKSQGDPRTAHAGTAPMASTKWIAQVTLCLKHPASKSAAFAITGCPVACTPNEPDVDS